MTETLQEPLLRRAIRTTQGARAAFRLRRMTDQLYERLLEPLRGLRTDLRTVERPSYRVAQWFLSDQHQRERLDPLCWATRSLAAEERFVSTVASRAQDWVWYFWAPYLMAIRNDLKVSGLLIVGDPESVEPEYSAQSTAEAPVWVRMPFQYEEIAYTLRKIEEARTPQLSVIAFFDRGKDRPKRLKGRPSNWDDAPKRPELLAMARVFNRKITEASREVVYDWVEIEDTGRVLDVLRGAGLEAKSCTDRVRRWADPVIASITPSVCNVEPVLPSEAMRAEERATWGFSLSPIHLDTLEAVYGQVSGWFGAYTLEADLIRPVEPLEEGRVRQEEKRRALLQERYPTLPVGEEIRAVLADADLLKGMGLWFEWAAGAPKEPLLLLRLNSNLGPMLETQWGELHVHQLLVAYVTGILYREVKPKRPDLVEGSYATFDELAYYGPTHHPYDWSRHIPRKLSKPDGRIFV